MRLDKILAESGVGTRKVVREYIIAGKVTVDNSIIMEPAAEIDEKISSIFCCGKHVIYPGKIYYMFHKPAGCVTARKDKLNQTVMDYFLEDCCNGIFPVGRLDKDTEGLLLLTNDGELDHKLMHPEHHMEKTYFFWAFGTLDDEAKNKLLSGVMIENDGEVAKALKIEVIEEGTYAAYEAVIALVSNRCVLMKDHNQPVVAGIITIAEGRKHQVKRMLKSVGCYVVYLKRNAIGQLSLDEKLDKGQYRKLTKEELLLLS
ncbi:MAG: pseudouridine synthase [Anaerocolumna sp.]